MVSAVIASVRAHGRTTCLYLMLATGLSLLGGCTAVTIDHYSTGEIAMEEHDAVVVLGRRFASNYDTEVDLISCVGDALGNGKSGLTVIPEQQFVDRLYPWFEPRTAPMRVGALKRLVQEEQIATVMDEYNIRHIIWIDGKTETTGSSGSIGCSIGAGGAGCFGFGTWDKESEYEASIWDYDTHKLLGKVSTDAAGTSYMPALIVPIPIIAPVQSSACKGMAEQLRAFYTSSEQTSRD
ncbi:MAG: hypothetical protein WDZ30_01465 [Cellvibrionaceae bacterium]